MIKQPRENNTVIIENIDYDGHYKIVIDYDQVNDNELNDMIIFADCYDLNDDLQDGYNYFPADIFFEMWFDNNCFNEGEKYNRLLRFQSYKIFLYKDQKLPCKRKYKTPILMTYFSRK